MSFAPSTPQRYRARMVMPIDAPAIPNAMIEVADGYIVDLQPFDGQSNTIDLGDVALLPRWVNAHTHLEFSDLSEALGQPGLSIADWIPAVIAHRGDGGGSAEQRVEAVLSGLQQSCLAGVGALGEIATRPWPLAAVANRLGGLPQWQLEMTVFHEVLGLTAERAASLLQWADQSINDARELSASSVTSVTSDWQHVTAGVSPHAPYSCPQQTLDSCIALAQRRSAPVAMHLAESLEERQLLEHADGPLYAMFSAMGLWDQQRPPKTCSIAETIQKLSLSPRAMIVHGNYLNDDEIDLIARHRQRLSVVYCPRTHAFFGHSPHPIDRLIQAGINVALGTDSRASNPDLNLGGEVQYLLNHRQDLAPSTVMTLATTGGCRALGIRQTWTIQPGALAQLVSIPCAGDTEASVWHSLATQTCQAINLCNPQNDPIDTVPK